MSTAELHEGDTDEQLLARGLEALIDTLGVSGAIRFVQSCTREITDYTATRHQWVTDVARQELWAEIEDIEAETQGNDHQ